MNRAAREAVPRRGVAITITPADACWADWIAHLHARGLDDIATAALRAQRMIVAARRPCAGVPTPAVDSRELAAVRHQRIAARITGDRTGEGDPT